MKQGAVPFGLNGLIVIEALRFHVRAVPKTIAGKVSEETLYRKKSAGVAILEGGTTDAVVGGFRSQKET